MKQIPLERLRALLSYDPETGNLTWFNRPRTDFPTELAWSCWNGRHAGKVCSYIGSRGYVVINLGGENFLGHRIAWALHYGRWPVGQVDHINHVRSDNRIENLRVVDRIGNARNATIARNNTSGVTGVSWSPVLGVWVAGIGHKNRWINLGRYSSCEEAAIARKAAEARLGFHPNHGRAA